MYHTFTLFHLIRGDLMIEKTHICSYFYIIDHRFTNPNLLEKTLWLSKRFPPTISILQTLMGWALDWAVLIKRTGSLIKYMYYFTTGPKPQFYILLPTCILPSIDPPTLQFTLVIGEDATLTGMVYTWSGNCITYFWYISYWWDAWYWLAPSG